MEDHNSPAASNAALDHTSPQCSNVSFDQNSALTSAQPPSSASSYDWPFLLSPSSEFADETLNPPFEYLSTWNSESASGSGHPSAYGQPSTLNNPLACSGQQLSVYPENADLTHGIGQSTASDAFKATEPEQSSFGASADELFQVSFASEWDLEKLSDIHARVSIDNPLACCIIRKPKDFASHLELGRFYYGQAFAAETRAIVLKVTNQVSGEIVGCAWLQVHSPLERHNKKVPLSRPGVSLPSCLKRKIYGLMYQKAHDHRRRAVKEGTYNYCKYLLSPFWKTSPKGSELMRSGNTIINVCLLVVRSLDVLDTLSVEHQSQVHRKLVLILSAFEPERDIFVQLRQSHLSDMMIFLDAGWEFTGDQVLKDCPLDLVYALRNCPIEDRTLSGLLRPGVEKARAQPQTSLSHAWPSPVAEVWQPRSFPLTTNPATCGDPDELSPKEQRIHDSARASNEARRAQQQVAVSEEQGPSSAQSDQQTLAGRQLPACTENSQQPVGSPQSYHGRNPPNEQYEQPQLGQPQRPDNQAIFSPKSSPAPYPTITVNFLANGLQIFKRPTQSGAAPFKYLSYRGVSTAMTVNDLFSMLRLKNATLTGVTVVFEMRVGDGWSALRKWGCGMTILQGTAAAEQTLAKVGWMPEASPVWLVVKM